MAQLPDLRPQFRLFALEQFNFRQIILFPVRSKRLLLAGKINAFFFDIDGILDFVEFRLIAGDFFLSRKQACLHIFQLGFLCLQMSKLRGLLPAQIVAQDPGFTLTGHKIGVGLAC